MLSSYDLKVLISLNKIQNSDSVKIDKITSWVLMKRLTPKARDLENSYVLTSLRKMNKIGIIDLHEENGAKIWTMNLSKVFFQKFNFPCGKKNGIGIILSDGKWNLYEI